MSILLGIPRTRIVVGWRFCRVRLTTIKGVYRDKFMISVGNAKAPRPKATWCRGSTGTRLRQPSPEVAGRCLPRQFCAGIVSLSRAMVAHGRSGSFPVDHTRGPKISTKIEEGSS